MMGRVERLPELVITPRLVIRRWLPEDAGLIRNAVQSSIEHLQPWMPWAAFEPVSDADRVELIRKWNADWEAGGDVVMGVLHEGVVVGGTGFHRRIGEGGLEIGYWIHVDHVGQGFATEASRGLTSRGFAIPGIDRIEIRHSKSNTRSSRIPEALGYVMVGEQVREPVAPAEAGVDCIWRMTKQAWIDTTAAN